MNDVGIIKSIRPWVPPFLIASAFFYSLSSNAPHQYDPANNRIQKIINIAVPIFVALGCGLMINLTPPIFSIGFVWGFVFPDSVGNVIVRIITIWKNSRWDTRLVLAITQLWWKWPVITPISFLLFSGELGRECSPLRKPLVPFPVP